MAEMSVKELAQQVKTTPERLLEQLSEAGVAVKNVDDIISSEQKRQLLMYLRSGHNASPVSEPATPTSPKITLKRKKVSVIKQAKGKAAVTVSVKSKRTFVKPGDTTSAETSAASSKVVEVVKTAPNVLPPAENTASSDDAAVPTVQEQDVPTIPTESSAPVTDTDTSTVRADVPAEKEKKKKAAPESDSYKKKKSASRREKKYHDDYEQDDHQLHMKIGRRKKKKGDKSVPVTLEHSFEKPVAPVVREVGITESITVGELAQKMSIKVSEVIKVMMNMGVMATINQVIDQDTAVIIVQEMGHTPRVIQSNALEQDLFDSQQALGGDAIKRAPVVTIMGHVDHGKTSLLDYIRRTKVTAQEAGGITQHIGAYHVETERGMITFLDTPGHEAFTAMRARGAQCTDIVVLVVAADDGVMPQTKEAILHARAAGVPIVVAVNKIDKPEADPEKIKTGLSQHDVIPEEWGGDVMFQNLSAKTGEGVDNLLESILLQAEVLELTAVAEGPAKGMVIESRLDKGRGSVATILVTAGKLNKGDVILAGREFGRVRAMIGDDGLEKLSVGPSMPVEILGLSGTPAAGDDVLVAPNEKKAREIAQFRQTRHRESIIAKQHKAKLERLTGDMKAGEQSTLNIVLKADVQGSVEAISESLIKLTNDQVKVNIVASGVGGITESDANLAIASDAVMIGFNVRADASTRGYIEREGIELHYHSIIYNVIDQVKLALTGMLAPEYQEKIVGLAQVREVFRSSKLGAIAGCMVIDGVMKRNLPIRVLRDNVVIYEGELESLRRYKEDAAEVRSGTECGIGVKNYNDVKVNDEIEAFEKVEVQRSLD